MLSNPLRRATTASHQGNPFQIRCEAGDGNRFSITTDSILVTVSQRVLRDGVLEMWDSVTIYAKQDIEGALVVEVLVFNPNWDRDMFNGARLQLRPRSTVIRDVDFCYTAKGGP